MQQGFWVIIQVVATKSARRGGSYILHCSGLARYNNVMYMARVGLQPACCAVSKMLSRKEWKQQCCESPVRNPAAARHSFSRRSDAVLCVTGLQ